MLFGHVTTTYLVYDRINEIRRTAGLDGFVTLETSLQTPSDSLVAKLSRFVREVLAERVARQSIPRELGIGPVRRA